MSISVILQKISAFIVALTMIFTTTTAISAVGYTDGDPIIATEREYCFDNDRLLIGGYNLNNTSKTEDVVRYAKEAGLDFVIADGRESLLTLCDKYGLGVIATNYNSNLPYAYWNADKAVFDKWANITASQYNFSHTCLWGDNLIDEPTAAAFGNIQNACEGYYNNISGKLPFVNLFPMYASTEQLGNVPATDETVASVLFDFDEINTYTDSYRMHVSDYINTIDTDYICVDIYPLSQTLKEDGTVERETFKRWLRNLDILADACRQTNRDLWVITQSAGETDTESGTRFCDTAEDIRWQAYVTLAFGAKAIIHACYDGGWWDRNSHMIDANGDRTDTYYAVQTVNKELEAFADVYGDYVNQGVYLENGTLAAGNQPQTLTKLANKYKPSVKTYSPVLVGAFTAEEGNGKAYSIVNMWEPETNLPADATVTFNGAKSFTLYRNGVATEFEGDTLNITLENCEGVFVTVNY